MAETSLAGRKKIAVIGAGSWGTALAMVAARNSHSVCLWGRDQRVADEINRSHKNPVHLSDFELPQNITATTSLELATAEADSVVVVVPSHVFREVTGKLRDHLRPDTLLVSATKGVENGTLMRMSEVVADVLGPDFGTRFVALSGPSFAREVAQGDPTAIVAASQNPRASETVQQELSCAVFRIYTNSDTVGVELGGAVKNVVAIAAGVVRGLGMGTNS
ncbi:MAG TPA: NAD(P)H-dependent glycerol-3-phosphate dehydrogenase, partial [Blastocatellia bacterium]|nr:NAD(P)H-dependent glycerol-3-phosphate dehydrogenase [Blastocatellia bacterium]